jgi:HSP20 family protein
MLGLTRRNETALTRPTTAATRWDPWGEFDRLRTEMDQMFDRFLPRTARWSEASPVFSPAVDLYETADDVVLNAYLPGMSREDIHLEVLGDTIHIWGESKPNIPEKDVTVHLVQGGFGQFDFRYRLPVEVSAEGCKATYRNGVLEIRLPKSEAAKPRSIEVQIAG